MFQSSVHPALSRHDRLFELLRQENIATATRKRINRPASVTDDVRRLFQHRAETSFTGGIPVL